MIDPTTYTLRGTMQSQPLGYLSDKAIHKSAQILERPPLDSKKKKLEKIQSKKQKAIEKLVMQYHLEKRGQNESNLAEIGDTSSQPRAASASMINKSDIKIDNSPPVYDLLTNRGLATSQIKRGNSTIELDHKILKQNQEFEFKIQDLRSKYDNKLKESATNSVKQYNHLLQDIEKKTTMNKYQLQQFLKEKKLEVQQNNNHNQMKLLGVEDELLLKDNLQIKLEDEINHLLQQVQKLENENENYKFIIEQQKEDKKQGIYQFQQQITQLQATIQNYEHRIESIQKSYFQFQKEKEEEMSNYQEQIQLIKLELTKQQSRHDEEIHNFQLQKESDTIVFKGQLELKNEMLSKENQILQKTKGELLLKILELEGAHQKREFQQDVIFNQTTLMQQKIDKKQEINDYLKQQNIDYDDQMSKLRTTIEQLMLENNALRDPNSQEWPQISQNFKSTFENEYFKLKDLIKEKEIQLRSLRLRIQNLQEKNEEILTENQEVQALQEKVKNCQKTLREKQKEINELKENKEQNEELIESMNRELKSLYKKIDSLKVVEQDISAQSFATKAQDFGSINQFLRNFNNIRNNEQF